jgi:hypothetical protein
MAFEGAKHGVQLGAFGTQGGSWCHFENLHAYNTAAEPWDLLNFEHITIEGLYSFGCGHGPRIAMWAAVNNGGLGNSVVNKVYNFGGTSLSRGIVLGGVAGSPGASAGTMYYKHIQNNSFGRQPLDVSMTLTNANANIAVPPANINSYPLDTIVRFASAVGNFKGGAVGGGNRPAYFVVARNIGANTIQLSPDPRGAAQIPSAGGSVSTRSFGLPTIWFAGSGFGPGKVYCEGIDMEGRGNTCVISKMAGSTIKQLLFTSEGEECLTLRQVSGLVIESGLEFGLDADATGNSNILMNVAETARPISNFSAGGAGPIGIFRDGAANGQFALNLQGNRVGGAGGLPSMYNRSPGNGDFSCFGGPLAYKNGYSSNLNYSNINNGAFVVANAIFTGTGPGVWSWSSDAGIGMSGFRQLFKNNSKTPGATLTITLSGAGAGTFDGLLGGTSVGKSIILQPATGVNLGGCVVIMCVQTGASSYEWIVESIFNGALL